MRVTNHTVLGCPDEVVTFEPPRPGAFSDTLDEEVGHRVRLTVTVIDI
jgi:hypothetical protein